MEDRPPQLLDYAPPPERPLKRAERAFVALLWFVWRRRVRAVEVAVAGLLVLPLLYAANAPGLRYYVHPLATTLSIAVLLVTLGAAVILLIRARWRQLAATAVLFALTGPLTGHLQFARCPHATYLQVLGLSIPIWGDPCNNERDARPWWVRD